MNPFNLKDALAGKPICTADGRTVKFGAYNLDALPSQRVLGRVGDCAYAWTNDGKEERGCFPELDLFMVSEKHRETWYSVAYPEGVLCDLIPSQAKARFAQEQRRGPCRFVEVIVEWED